MIENKPLVTIPKEVAEAIDAAKKYVDSDELILSTYTEWSFLGEGIGEGATDVLMDYFDEHPHEYIQAINDGYEVKLSPKEKILELLEEAKKDEEDAILRSDELSVRYYQGSITAYANAIKIMGWELS